MFISWLIVYSLTLLRLCCMSSDLDGVYKIMTLHTPHEHSSDDTVPFRELSLLDFYQPSSRRSSFHFLSACRCARIRTGFAPQIGSNTDISATDNLQKVYHRLQTQKQPRGTFRCPNMRTLVGVFLALSLVSGKPKCHLKLHSDADWSYHSELKWLSLFPSTARLLIMTAFGMWAIWELIWTWLTHSLSIPHWSASSCLCLVM